MVEYIQLVAIRFGQMSLWHVSRCWMLARRGRKRYSMGLRSPLLPMEQQPAFSQLLTSRAPTFRLCKCLTTGSARCDAFLALHRTRSGGGKHQTLGIEGFLWVSEKNQCTAALPSHICLKVGSQQAGRKLQNLCAVSLLSLRCRSRYLRALGISAGDYLLHVHFISLPTSSGIVGALSSSWAAALWSLHFQLFTSGAFKDDKTYLFMLTKMI